MAPSLIVMVVGMVLGLAVAEMCRQEVHPTDYCIDATCGQAAQNPDTFHPCECTEDNIGYEFTECNVTSKTRSLVYFWRPPATCYGGLSLPNHLENVPCDLQCTSGKHLDLSTHTCRACQPGSYSLGGGVVWDSWQVMPAQFESQCIIEGYTTKCNPWRPQGRFIDSGDNSKDYGAFLNSVLRLQFHLAVRGSLQFGFRVASEGSFVSGASSQFIYKLDGQYRFSYATRDWRLYTDRNIEPGFHVAEFIYQKGAYVSMGEDRVVIGNITLLGTSVADINCVPCSPGKYVNFTSAVQCLDCPIDTFSGWGATECTPCPPDQHSFPGSPSCIARTQCTENDYYYSFSECVVFQTKSYHWLEPAACITVNSTLPASETYRCNYTEVLCPDGTYVDGFHCEFCPDGTFSNDPTDTACTPCPAGSSSGTRLRFLGKWDHWPAFFATGCEGDCLSEGWRLGSYFIDSGSGNSPSSRSWMQVELPMINGNLTFTYTFSCSNPESSLRILVDGLPGLNIPCTGCSTSINVGVVPVLYLPTGGTRQFRFTYLKGLHSKETDLCDRMIIYNMTFQGVEKEYGGAASCYSCEPGHFSIGNGGSGCFACEGGTYSADDDATTCSPCPANTFSYPASSSCTQCGHTTTTEEGMGDSKCEYDCADIPLYALLDKPAVNGSETYDISYFSFNPIEVDDEKSGLFFYINLCEPYRTPCSKFTGYPSYVCLENEFGGMEDIGNVIGFYAIEGTPQIPDRKGIAVEFSNSQTNCSASVNLICVNDPRDLEGTPVYHPEDSDPENCRYSFDFPSIYGCPLCSPVNYFLVIYPCINGKTTHTYFWNTSLPCHDGVPLPASDYTLCTSEEESVLVKQSVLVGLIVGLVSVVVLAGAGLTYLYVSKRRMEVKYASISQASLQLENREVAEGRVSSDDSQPTYSIN